MSALLHLMTLPGVVGAAKLADGHYRIDLAEGGSRPATTDEVLFAIKSERIDAINAECRSRIIARYGSAEEQVSRSIGIYGAAEQAAMLAGIAAAIDASNEASNAVIAASDVAAVGAVTATWPQL